MDLGHTFVRLNKSFIHLVQYGGRESIVRSSPLASPRQTQAITTTTTTKNRGKTKLIIFLPGNPGTLGMYHDFLSLLHKTITSPSDKSNNQPVILAIGHNNFDHPDLCQYPTQKRVHIEENDLNFVEKSLVKQFIHQPHHVELQVLNKLIILKRLLSVDLNDCQLIFIGHSIGCYIILRLLQDKQVSQNHSGTILIHPALENLALTPKGSQTSRYLTYRLDLLAKSLAFMIETLLPDKIKLRLTRWYCNEEFVEKSSDIVLESLYHLIGQSSLDALFQMAKSEFDTIKNLDHHTMIKPHVDKLKLIYAKNDHWVNPRHKLELEANYPELYMDQEDTMHAFIMEPQTVSNYAVKVGMFIQDFIE